MKKKAIVPKNSVKSTRLEIVDKLSALIEKTGQQREVFAAVVSILGILFSLIWQIYPQVNWSQIHIEPTWELLTFLITTLIIIINRGIKIFVKVEWKKRGSVRIEPPISFIVDNSIDKEEIERKLNPDNKFSSRFVTSRNLYQQSSDRERYNTLIQDLTNLAEEAFPRGKGAGRISYAKSRDERRDAFRLWTRFNPETAQIIYYDNEPIGMSLMLRLSENTYANYRNGKDIRSWEIEERDLVNTDDPDTPYLFFQYIYCKESKNYDASQYMCWVFLNHLSIIWQRSGHEPVLVAPRKTDMGKENAEILGFTLCGQNFDFPLYELDLRHPNELNRNARQVYQVLRQLIE